jgi:aldehyde dehydrogenase (NAD+)
MIKKYYSYINGEQQKNTVNTINKIDPSANKVQSKIEEIDTTVLKKKLKSFRGKLEVSHPQRSKIISSIIENLQKKKQKIIDLLVLETGRKRNDCLGEFDASISCAEFFLGEGYRLYGNTRKSFDKDKIAFSIREPCGVALLIIASNTPLANLSWKFFPAFVAGNKIILKGSEDVPILNDFFYKILIESGVPIDEIMLIQGSGSYLTDYIIKSNQYDVISFTGSTAIGKLINQECSKNLTKVSLELGGKNSIYIDEDCDIENALNFTLSSSFSNAGQRCASSSKIIVHKKIYNDFKKKLIAKTSKLSVGKNDKDFLGPVINEKLFNRHINLIKKYKEYLISGKKNLVKKFNNNFNIYPTLIENPPKNEDIYYEEIFGPISLLFKASDIHNAIALCNDSIYGLTASIHTKSIANMKLFMQKVNAGVCNINTGTHGSEPHFPFGGLKDSGNGTREPGETAIDIYTNFKNISIK